MKRVENTPSAGGRGVITPLSQEIREKFEEIITHLGGEWESGIEITEKGNRYLTVKHPLGPLKVRVAWYSKAERRHYLIFYPGNEKIPKKEKGETASQTAEKIERILLSQHKKANEEKKEKREEC